LLCPCCVRSDRSRQVRKHWSSVIVYGPLLSNGCTWIPCLAKGLHATKLTCTINIKAYIFPLEDGHKTETCSGYWIKYSNLCCVRRKPWTWSMHHKCLNIDGNIWICISRCCVISVFCMAPVQNDTETFPYRVTNVSRHVSRRSLICC
jgi:hypothetical protein